MMVTAKIRGRAQQNLVGGTRTSGVYFGHVVVVHKSLDMTASFMYLSTMPYHSIIPAKSLLVRFLSGLSCCALVACGGGGGGSETQRSPSRLAYDYVDGFTNMAPTTTAELNALRDSMAQSSPGQAPLLTYEGRGRVRVEGHQDILTPNMTADVNLANNDISLTVQGESNVIPELSGNLRLRPDATLAGAVDGNAFAANRPIIPGTGLGDGRGYRVRGADVSGFLDGPEAGRMGLEIDGTVEHYTRNIFLIDTVTRSSDFDGGAALSR
jgi:hypothetical protein